MVIRMHEVKYNETIYPARKDTYTPKLCKYLMQRFFRGQRLVDLGCGTGVHIKEFKRDILDCMGVDKKDCNLEYEELPISNIIHPKGYFDNAFCKSVIEHINNPDNLIKQTYRILKPEGVFVIMTPDWKSQMSHFWDDYTHVHPYTRKSLMNLFKIHGFKNVGCEYFYQLPYIWKYPWLSFIPKIISILPDSLKWKDDSMSNGKDRKWIRFSKEKMLLAWGYK